MFGLAAKSHLSPFVCVCSPASPRPVCYPHMHERELAEQRTEDPSFLHTTHCRLFLTKTLFSVIFAQNSRFPHFYIARRGSLCCTKGCGNCRYAPQFARGPAPPMCIAPCASPAAPLFTFWPPSTRCFFLFHSLTLFSLQYCELSFYKASVYEINKLYQISTLKFYLRVKNVNCRKL